MPTLTRSTSCAVAVSEGTAVAPLLRLLTVGAHAASNLPKQLVHAIMEDWSTLNVAPCSPMVSLTDGRGVNVAAMAHGSGVHDVPSMVWAAALVLRPCAQ